MAAKKETKKAETKELDKSIDKEKLDGYIKRKVDDEVRDAVDESTKKLLRHKNIIILKRDLAIVILLIFYVLLCYNLYSTNYFERFFKNSNNTSNATQNTATESKESTIESESTNEEELLDKYSPLLDSIKINSSSSYFKDYYSDKLDNKLKLYLAFNNIDESEISCEDDTCDLEESILKSSFNDIFGDDFKPESFDLNGTMVRYLKNQNIFIYSKKDSDSASNDKVVRVVTHAKENDDEIELETVEGLVKGDKLYNILTDKEVGSYKSDKTVKDNSKKLTNLKYTFDEDKHLTKIEVM